MKINNQEYSNRLLASGQWAPETPATLFIHLECSLAWTDGVFKFDRDISSLHVSRLIELDVEGRWSQNVEILFDSSGISSDGNESVDSQTVASNGQCVWRLGFTTVRRSDAEIDG